MKITEITPDNIEQFGLFCSKSKNAQTGIDGKLTWFKGNYKNGLRMLYALENETVQGFIEYTTGAHIRNITASGYAVINCLWTKGGCGLLLLNECLKKTGRMDGIAVLTSNNMWLCSREIFIRNGFTSADNYKFTKPVYGKKLRSEIELLFRKNKTNAAVPEFDFSYQKEIQKLKGINIIYSDQCPFISGKLEKYRNLEKRLNTNINYLKLDSMQDFRKYGGIYGAFAVVINGEYITHTIVGEKGLEKIIRK